MPSKSRETISLSLICMIVIILYKEMIKNGLLSALYTEQTADYSISKFYYSTLLYYSRYNNYSLILLVRIRVWNIMRDAYAHNKCNKGILI
jgi:hypothetical protein